MLKKEELLEKIRDMFFGESFFTSGAIECVKELIGEGYRPEVPYLKALILRELLYNSKPYYIIKYGIENPTRDTPKYNNIYPELFEDSESAFRFVNYGPFDDGVNNIIFEPYMVEEI